MKAIPPSFGRGRFAKDMDEDDDLYAKVHTHRMSSCSCWRCLFESCDSTVCVVQLYGEEAPKRQPVIEKPKLEAEEGQPRVPVIEGVVAKYQ